MKRRRRPGLGRHLLSIAVVSGTVYCAFWTAWTWTHLGDERDRVRQVVRRSADRAAAASAAIDVGALARPGCTVEAAEDLAGHRRWATDRAL